MADGPNAVRDPQARIDELLKANNAEVERRRAAEKRYDDLAEDIWRVIDGAKLDFDVPSCEVNAVQRLVWRLEEQARALDAEKMANAQMFEGLWNIKRAAVDRPPAAALGTLSYIYEVANALAPEAPAKTEGGAA